MAKKLLACALALALLFSACAERIFEPTDAVDGKKRALEVFLECGFSAEYGDSTGCLQRWEAPIVICVYGEPTDEDWEQLEGFLMELSQRAEKSFVCVFSDTACIYDYYVCFFFI